MVRTRFAPSPTGYLHVGGLRAALYAYLFAKKNGGTFILRIEDTDQKRFVEGAMENLINTLTYAGLTIDEGPISPEKQIGDHGPYIQSQRTELYREHVQQLINNGHAYRCFCTKERLDEMRQRQLAQGQPTMYDRKCADLPESEVTRLISEGHPFVIRQKIPYEVIKFKDIIRGNVQFHGKTVDDQVLMKSDGFPTYHLANVVDDHLMEITHVIRGEEWLPSTPKHLALYQAFGWKAPQFAHMPLLLNADRTKLSKRQGDVAVENYVEKGYLKEAIINFITFLGWNPGAGETREIFTLKELEEIFELDKVHKSGAIFDLEKLNWFNQKWQRRKLDEQLSNLAKNIDPQVEIETNNKGQISYTFSSASTETKFQEERGEILKTLLKQPLETPLNGNKLLFALVTIEDKIIREPDETKQHLTPFEELANYPSQLLTHEKMGVDLRQAALALQAALEDLKQLSDWRPTTIKQQIINTISKLGIKNGQMLWPLRVALSGQEFSPGPFDLAWGLGKDQSIDRIKIAITKCQ